MIKEDKILLVVMETSLIICINFTLVLKQFLLKLS